MTPGFEHYTRIRNLGRDSVTYLCATADIPNNYGHPSETPPIPRGAVIRSEFGHDSGLYGRYSMPGSPITLRCQVLADDFHLLEFVETTA